MPRASPSAVQKFSSKAASIQSNAFAVSEAERSRTFFFKRIQEFVGERIGDNGIQILNCVGEGATDEKIEEQTKFRISEIRSILNHLHSYGFVEYTRSKNLSNGWFTYTWKINMDRAMQNFLTMKKREYAELSNSLPSEDSVIFSCRKGCDRFSFDEALERQFKCAFCKTDLRVFDGSSERKKIESKISALEKILSNPSRKW